MNELIHNMTSKVTRVNICNIPVDALTMKQTVEIIDVAIQDKRLIHHVVINAAKVVNAQKNKELKNSITNSDIINADGTSIVWASKLLNQPVPEQGQEVMHCFYKKD